MSVISMKQLLEAGVHFGHQTRRWNPKMAPYIFTERNGIHIIDLQKTVGLVDDAYKAVFDIANEGGTILFVGTKKQAQDAVKTEAERCGMYYVNERWLGGMLTNFKTIQTRIDRLKAIEKMSEDGTFEVLPKKEVIQIKKEWEKLEKNIGGIKDMTRIPDAIFVVDPKKEAICVKEARSLGITLIGIGIMDKTGFLDSLFYILTRKTNKKIVTFVLSFICILSSISGDLGFIVYIPLAALLFKYGKRHPKAGIICAFASIACGYGINLFMNSIDTSLVAYTNQAANLLSKDYNVGVFAFLVVMILTSIILASIISSITEKVTIPKL